MYNVLSQIEIEQLEHPFIGKLVQKIRDNRAEKKAVKQANKIERINARQQGGGVLGRAASAVGSIFGKTGTTPTEDMVMQERGLSYTDPETLAAQQQKQLVTYIIVGVIILAIVILLFAYLRNKNKKKKD